MNADILKEGKKDLVDIDLGFILWKLETIQDFLPCYKTIMRQKQE
jgi:hypothetical protein